MGCVSRSTSSINRLALVSIASTASFPKNPGMTRYLVVNESVSLRKMRGFKLVLTHSRKMRSAAKAQAVSNSLCEVDLGSQSVWSVNLEDVDRSHKVNHTDTDIYLRRESCRDECLSPLLPAHLRPRFSIRFATTAARLWTCGIRASISVNHRRHSWIIQ